MRTCARLDGLEEGVERSPVRALGFCWPILRFEEAEASAALRGVQTRQSFHLEGGGLAWGWNGMGKAAGRNERCVLILMVAECPSAWRPRT